MSEQNKKGFTVTDRRIGQDQEGQAKAEAEAQAPGSSQVSSECKCPEAFPPMTFASFIISLNTSALIHLGLLPDPGTGQTHKEPELARQTIDLLGILKEKTRNNLSKEEQDLLDNLLFDLRLKFVELCK